MVSRVLASDGTFAKGFLDSRPTANFEQNFDRAGRGMLRTLLRVAGRANLDRRDACRLGGSENHIDDGDDVDKRRVVQEIEELEAFVTSPRFQFLDQAQQ